MFMNMTIIISVNTFYFFVIKLNSSNDFFVNCVHISSFFSNLFKKFNCKNNDFNQFFTFMYKT